MSFFSSMNHRGVWFTTLMASAILMITMGTRQSMGLYVGPLNTDTGLGIVTISLAMAIGQFVCGAVQPPAAPVSAQEQDADADDEGLVRFASAFVRETALRSGGM